MPTHDELVLFVQAKAVDARARERGRLDDAEAWRSGTDDEHEAARLLGERLGGGGPLAPTTAAEREAIAKRQVAIAAKHAAEAVLYEAVVAALQQAAARQAELDSYRRDERWQAATTGDGFGGAR